MKQTKEEKIADLKEDMKTQMVNTPGGHKISMYDPCEVIGIKQRVSYFDIVAKTSLRKKLSIKEYDKSEKKTFNYGFIFNNGIEIKNVSKVIYNLYPVEKIEKIERYPLSLNKRESKRSLSMFDVKNEIKSKQ